MAEHRWSHDQSPPGKRGRGVPTRRTGEKNGSKRHLLVDGRGVPLSLIVTGANRHDVSQLERRAGWVVIVLLPQKDPFLYGDRGYEGEPAQVILAAHGYRSRVTPEEAERGRPQRIDAGWWKPPTPGSTGFASSWCGMRNWLTAMRRSFIWLLPLSVGGRWLLFTDRSLVNHKGRRFLREALNLSLESCLHFLLRLTVPSHSCHFLFAQTPDPLTPRTLPFPALPATPSPPSGRACRTPP